MTFSLYMFVFCVGFVAGALTIICLANRTGPRL